MLLYTYPLLFVSCITNHSDRTVIKKRMNTLQLQLTPPVNEIKNYNRTSTAVFVHHGYLQHNPLCSVFPTYGASPFLKQDSGSAVYVSSLFDIAREGEVCFLCKSVVANFYVFALLTE
jgi:hypothetical protein